MWHMKPREISTRINFTVTQEFLNQNHHVLVCSISDWLFLLLTPFSLGFSSPCLSFPLGDLVGGESHWEGLAAALSNIQARVAGARAATACTERSLLQKPSGKQRTRVWQRDRVSCLEGAPAQACPLRCLSQGLEAPWLLCQNLAFPLESSSWQGIVLPVN